MSNAILEVSALTKKFGHETALDSLKMTVKPRDIYGFVGQNGSGKTTTMKIILSMIKADAGSISLFGKTGSNELRQLRERIGAIVESPSFYPYMSARDNLTYYAKFKGITNKKIIGETLETVGLADTGRKKFKDFSLGMKERLGLALAIMNQPDFLILDEPLNGLDPQGIIAFRQTLQRMNQELGVTILISSHILDELQHVATKYGFIHQGRMVEEITAEALQERCGKFLLLKLEDTKKAAFVLEEEVHTQHFQVLDDYTIQLFDFVDDSQRVVSALIKNDIGVREVERKGISLEKYYLNLISEGGQAHA